MVPDDLRAKVTLEAITYATQLDGLVVDDVSGRIAMHDMHTFGANPKWSRNRNLCIWEKMEVVTEANTPRLGIKGLP